MIHDKRFSEPNAKSRSEISHGAWSVDCVNLALPKGLQTLIGLTNPSILKVRLGRGEAGKETVGEQGAITVREL